MKSKNTLAIALIIAGVVLFIAIQGGITPRTALNNQQDDSSERNPQTQDFEIISKYKSRYMGDAPNLTGLFYELPLRDLEMSFRLYPEKYTAEVNYKALASDIGENTLDRAIAYNATAAFALIDNLEEVIFNFEGSSFRILRNDVEEWYGVGLQALAEKTAWKEEVQSKLDDTDYLQSCLKAIISHEERSTAETLLDFYDKTDEPIVIYDEMPFEDGTLVLAEKLTDGEHYPDLHFIDEDYKVTFLTRGSYCWTLNYTEFKGHYIYFGLAGVEARQYGENDASVNKVEALFSDRIASVIPRERIIGHVNLKENDTRVFADSQGYILSAEGREIPQDFIFITEKEERKPVLRMHIERNKEYMPEYLKSNDARIYNSYAFTFTPMLTPTEWNKSYKEGEICLEGKTDADGNRNLLNLRPAGHMNMTDSFIIPQDIRPFYLSDNNSRLAYFSPGETVRVIYPGNRELMDCRILGLTKNKAEKGIGQDSLGIVESSENRQLTLPKDTGYYFFLLRTMEGSAIQTYSGIIRIESTSD